MSLPAEYDVIVVGGGIAGIGAAARLASDARVLVLERERHPGTHATGRSAAMLLDDYGNATIRALTAAGRPFYAAPDPAFWPTPLLAPRGELLLARPGEEAAAEEQLAAMRAAERLTPAEAVRLVPILDADAISFAVHVRDARNIDVDAALQGFLRLLRTEGGTIASGAEVTGLARADNVWRVTATAGDFTAPVVVDAAGAWADGLAALAGLAPLGLQPLRRSAAILPAPTGHDISRWPLFGSISEDWYAKPMGGKLMVSPAEEEPVEAQDAFPDDMVLAEGLDRFERMTTMQVTRVERSWAGLRTFAPDRTPVAGFDPRAEGFFWLAGQGGYGIQTAPALSALAADLILGRETALTPEVLRALAPDRLLRNL